MGLRRRAYRGPRISQPTWSCPGGQCACHGAPTTEEHRIHLFDRLGHPNKATVKAVIAAIDAILNAAP